MSDIKLNEASGDIDITNNVTRLITESDEALQQRIKIRLKTFKGEWFLNGNSGLPYYQTIFKKGTPKDLVDSIYRSYISRINGVTEIESFSASLNQQLRTYTLDFTVKTTTGTTLTVTNFEV